jgi:hypothetical protein
MAPVIRISEQVFRRLQRLGEPLVDTPSSVIERVVEHYEKSAQPRNDGSPAIRLQAEPSSPVVTVSEHLADFNLFLVPARSMNLAATIRNPVPLQVAQGILTEDQFTALATAVSPATDFRCWATNQQNRALFERMRPGDAVLLTEKGTGKFNYRATIATKLVSEKLAARLWPDVPGLPWKFIYVLKALTRISVRKEAVVAALGYDPSFWVPGHIHVNSSRVYSILAKHGSLDHFLETCK